MFLTHHAEEDEQDSRIINALITCISIMESDSMTAKQRWNNKDEGTKDSR